MESKMKILFVIDQINEGTGGTETQLIRIIEKLDKKRFQVGLLLFKDSPWYKRIPEKYKIFTTLIQINTFKKVGTYFRLLNMFHFIRKMEPDIVHTFFPVANIVGVFIARLAGVRNIVSSRRDYGEWITPAKMVFTRVANLFVTKILSNSYCVRNLTIDLEKVGTEKVEVIYNGLDVNNFVNEIEKYRKDDVRGELNIPENRKVIGTVANLRPMKRLDTLLFAACEVIKSYPDVCFLIVGTGSEEDKLRKLTKDLGLQDVVIFLGRQYDVARYLSIFDIGVNCSDKEGLSNAIMEYLTAGIPVVASESGGNEELIQNGINGFTFQVGDYKMLTDRLLLLLRDKSYGILFRKKSEEIIRKINIEQMVENFECFYERLYNESHSMPTF